MLCWASPHIEAAQSWQSLRLCTNKAEKYTTPFKYIKEIPVTPAMQKTQVPTCTRRSVS